MKFEQMENTWGLQQSSNSGTPDLEKLQHALKAHVNHRRRMIWLGIGGMIFGLVIMQVLFFANFSYTRPDYQWMSLSRHVLRQVVNLTILFALVRLFLQKHRWACIPADSIREVETQRLAFVEEEMKEYRWTRWVFPVWLALPLFSVYINQPVSQVGWEPFLLRAGLIFGIFVPVGLVMWRHYRKNLRPERDQLRDTLNQMD